MTNGPRVLIAGCGNAGTRHIKNLKSIGVKKFILLDTDRLALEKASYGLENPVSVTTLSDAFLERADTAVISVPPAARLEPALELARRGVHVFIESPISTGIEGVKALEALVREKGIVGMAGLYLRFHPAFQHIKNLLDSQVIGRVLHVNYSSGLFLPDRHPHADYRGSWTANAREGGGAVMAGINSLDAVRWLFGEVRTMHCFLERAGDLGIDVEDLATGFFIMESGARVTWHSDLLQRSGLNMMVVTGQKGTIKCDFMTGSVETYFSDFGKWFSGKLSCDMDSMYMDASRHFLECVLKRKTALAGINEGRRTLDLARNILGSGRQG